MVEDLITILVFGVIGYFLGRSDKPASTGWMNVLLVVLLLIAANIHGAYVGNNQLQVHVSAILEGVFGGLLIRRLKPGDVSAPRDAADSMNRV